MFDGKSNGATISTPWRPEEECFEFIPGTAKRRLASAATHRHTWRGCALNRTQEEQAILASSESRERVGIKVSANE